MTPPEWVGQIQAASSQALSRFQPTSGQDQVNINKMSVSYYYMQVMVTFSIPHAFFIVACSTSYRGHFTLGGHSNLGWNDPPAVTQP